MKNPSLWSYALALFAAWKERAQLIQERNEALEVAAEAKEEASQAKKDRAEMREVFIESYLAMYKVVESFNFRVKPLYFDCNKLPPFIRQFQYFHTMAQKWDRTVPEPLAMLKRALENHHY